MDKTTRLILGIAVLVIFPTLVIIGAVQFINFADKDKPTAPAHPDTYTNRPSCPYPNTENKGYQSTTDISNVDKNNEYNSCLTKQVEYDQKARDALKQYDKEKETYQTQYQEYIKIKNKESVLRAITILIVSIVSLVAGYKLREIKELAGSLVVASSLMITGSTITLAYLTQKDIYPKISNILTLFSFVVVVYIMYLIEKTAFNKNDFPVSNNADAAVAAKNIIANKNFTNPVTTANDNEPAVTVNNQTISPVQPIINEQNNQQ